MPTQCPLAVQEVDGQLVTAQERAFVETVLMNDESSQPSTADAVMGLEPQRTIKINHLSFNENGELLNLCFGECCKTTQSRRDHGGDCQLAIV